MFNTILVVCIGNICRSPTGERLLQHYLPNKIVSSAGIHAVVGSAAYKTAVEVANEHNLSLEGHISRQLTAAICQEYELILVMEKNHIDAVSQISPAARGKTMLFGHWLNQMDIADPYGHPKPAFELAYKLLDDAAQQWATHLKN